MELEFVTSSNLDVIGFGVGPAGHPRYYEFVGQGQPCIDVNRPDDLALFIRFKRTGKCYRYDGATYTTFDALRKAESVGQHFNQFIKDKFPTSPLDIDFVVEPATA